MRAIISGDAGEIKHVLVVDDDASILRMMARIFRHVGFEVTEAANGREAIEQIHNFSFDIVVTDMHMPEFNGNDVARVAKMVSKKTKVILCYSPNHETPEQELFDWISQKPTDFSVIISVLRNFFCMPVLS